MRIIDVLSTNPTGKVAARFKDEFKKRDINAVVHDLNQAQATDFRNSKLVFTRIAPEYERLWEPVYQNINQLGIRMVNSYDASRISRDKYLSYKRFLSKQVATPKTEEYQQQSFDQLADTYGLPFLLKKRNGTGGEGIYMIQTVSDFRNVPKDSYIVQAFLGESKGVDYRLIVVDGQVIAGMKKQATNGNFRSNIHQGAIAEIYSPSDEVAALSVKAAHAVGLEIAGVDVLLSNDGPVILEANVSPGLVIEYITGINVAEKICNYLVSQLSRSS